MKNPCFLLEQSHDALLEIAEWTLINTKPSSLIGLSVSKAVILAREIKKSVAPTTDS